MSMTPLQYQKQLRLLEARRLMVADGANVMEAALQVGYESASQFSREYTRMFGTPPKRDTLRALQTPLARETGQQFGIIKVSGRHGLLGE